MPLPVYLDPNFLYWLTHITGTAGDDTLYGSVYGDTINALGGNDVIYANGGNDVVDGGTGDDYIDGGQGNDQLQGGDGDDYLDGMTGNDLLLGGQGHDSLHGGDGYDRAFGGDGNDFVDGGDQNDELYGEAGNDNLWGGSGDDVVDGGQGHDNLEGLWGNDILHGGAGNDSFDDDDNQRGSYGADWYYGGDGDDSLIVADMADALTNHINDGGTGFDRLEIVAVGQTIAGIGLLAANTVNIEAIGLAYSGDTTLVVNPRDVLDFSADDTLFVTGGQDAVFWPITSQVTSDHSDGNFWTATGTAYAHGMTFASYQSVVDGQLVQLYVDTWLPQTGLTA